MVHLLLQVGMLYAGRLICGLAVGATTVAVPLYTNEIAEDKVRGALGVYLDMMLTTGILVVYCLGALFSCLQVTAICGAACPLLAAAFCLMPESPTYLLADGKPEKSERALRWLRGKQAPLGSLRATSGPPGDKDRSDLLRKVALQLAAEVLHPLQPPRQHPVVSKGISHRHMMMVLIMILVGQGRTQDQVGSGGLVCWHREDLI